MSGYTKMFSSIITSTIWQESLATKVMWITMLAMANKNSVVEGSIPGIAHLAGVSLEEANVALEKFMAPDEYSRSSEHEGRRVEKVDGGWKILNRDKYRAKLSEEERKEYRADWMKKKRAAVHCESTDVHDSSRVNDVDTVQRSDTRVQEETSAPTNQIPKTIETGNSTTTDLSESFHVAQAIRDELLVTDRKSIDMAQQQAAIYLAKDESKDEIRDRMLRSWKAYQASDEKAKFGLDRFLGTGEWRNPKWDKRKEPVSSSTGELAKIKQRRAEFLSTQRKAAQ